jgi:hypothetical protein
VPFTTEYSSLSFFEDVALDVPSPPEGSAILIYTKYARIGTSNYPMYPDLEMTGIFTNLGHIATLFSFELTIPTTINTFDIA